MTAQRHQPHLKSSYEIAQERASELEAAAQKECNSPAESRTTHSFRPETVTSMVVIGLALVIFGWMGLSRAGYVKTSPPDRGDASSSTRISSPAPTTKAWYVGGTLHRASAQDWVKAELKNRLATAADFVVANERRQGATSVDTDELLSKATALEVCISEAVEDQPDQLGKSLSVRDVGAACLVLVESQASGR